MVVVVALVAAFWGIKTVPVVGYEAVNTAVFTGQIIPAYEGAAYDPTVAFQYLSGLPVYVFVYNRWDGTPGNIIDQLAVRTQIRADGSFQAMGVPHGSNYGVFFPFSEHCYSHDFDTGVDTGMDCALDEAPCAAGHTCTKVVRVKRNDGLEVEPQTAPFRFPKTEDHIQDVFSYAVAPDDSFTLHDQQGNEVTVHGAQSFITSVNRLDIQSHINVFPVVPATVLSVKMRPEGQVLEGSFEVYAVRIARRAAPGELHALIQANGGVSNEGCTCGGTGCVYNRDIDGDGVLDGCRAASATGFGTEEIFMPTGPLVVKGRSSRLSGAGNYAWFRAFAPPGYYAVTVWKTEEGLPYTRYATNAVLGTGFSAVEFQFVDNSTDSSWGRENLGGPESEGVSQVLVHQRSSSVWGRVLENVSLSSTQLNYSFSVLKKGVSLKLDTLATSGDFGYDYYAGAVANTTNRFGIFEYESYQNVLSHGVKVGVDHTGYLQAQDSAYITPDSGPYQTQDFILQPEPAEGLEVVVGIQSDGEFQGLNGVAVSVICSNCPWGGAKGGGEVSSLIGYTRYEKDLTQENPGYFYFPKQTFIPGMKYVVTFTTSRFTGRCEIANAQDYSGSLQNLRDFCVGDDDSTGPNNELILSPRSSELSFFPRLQIPNVFAQEEVVLDCSNAPDLDGDDVGDVVLKGAIKPEVFNGWKATVVPFLFFSRSGSEVSQNVSPAEAGAELVREAEQLTQESVEANIKVLSLGSTLGKVVADEETSTFEIQFSCDELKAFGEKFKLRLSASVEENSEEKNEGTGRSTGETIVEIAPVYETWREHTTEQSVLRGFSVSPRQPIITVVPDCPGVHWNNLSVDRVIAAAGCNLTKSAASMVPDVFNTLEHYILRTEPLNNMPTVVRLWNSMRIIANSLTIVVLFLIGFMTIFRISPKEFSPGKALTGLIISLLFINFSLLICQVFIDVNNMLVSFLFGIFGSAVRAVAEAGEASAAGVAGGVAAIGPILSAGIISILMSAVSAGGAVAFSGGTVLPAVAAGIFVLGTTIALAVLSFAVAFFMIFLIRYAVVWLCVILAPLVFFLGNIPFFSKVKDAWWKLFIGFTVLQTLMALIIGIGMAMLLGLEESVSFTQGMFQLLIAVGVLYLGIKSPTSILGMFGLDMGAGQALKVAGGMAEPLQKQFGAVQEKIGKKFSREEMFRKKEEEASREMYWKAAGISGLGLTARKFFGKIGFGRVQSERIAHAEKLGKLKKTAWTMALEKQFGITKPVADAGVSVFYNAPLDTELIDRTGKDVLPGLTVGDIKKHYKDHNEFIKATQLGGKAKDYEVLAKRNVDLWIQTAAEKMAGPGASDSDIEAAKERIMLDIVLERPGMKRTPEGIAEAKEILAKKGLGHEDYDRIQQAMREAVGLHGNSLKTRGVPWSPRAKSEGQPAMRDQVSQQARAAGAVLPSDSQQGQQTIPTASKRWTPKGGLPSGKKGGR